MEIPVGDSVAFRRANCGRAEPYLYTEYTLTPTPKALLPLAFRPKTR